MVPFTSEGGILIGNGEPFVIHELRHQGLSISAIARQASVDFTPIAYRSERTGKASLGGDADKRQCGLSSTVPTGG